MNLNKDMEAAMLKANILMEADDILKDKDKEYEEAFLLGASLVWNFWQELMTIWNKNE